MRVLKYYRIRKDMTQQELADRVNVSQPKISQLENGIVKVSVSVLQEIADVLDYSGDPLKLCEVWQDSLI